MLWVDYTVLINQWRAENPDSLGINTFLSITYKALIIFMQKFYPETIWKFSTTGTCGNFFLSKNFLSYFKNLPITFSIFKCLGIKMLPRLCDLDIYLFYQPKRIILTSIIMSDMYMIWKFLFIYNSWPQINSENLHFHQKIQHTLRLVILFTNYFYRNDHLSAQIYFRYTKVFISALSVMVKNYK